jgi:hypothetical protein
MLIQWGEKMTARLRGAFDSQTGGVWLTPPKLCPADTAIPLTVWRKQGLIAST